MILHVCVCVCVKVTQLREAFQENSLLSRKHPDAYHAIILSIYYSHSMEIFEILLAL